MQPPGAETDPNGGIWSVTRAPGSRIIFLVYAGVLKGNLGDLASKRFVELAGNDQVYLAADFTKLESYETRVRTDWQKNAWPIRKQISGIAIATSNVVVKMGVAAFALFVGASTAYFKTRQELDQYLGVLSAQRT